MNIALLLWMILSGAQEWRETKKKFSEEWGSQDPTRQAEAVRALSTCDIPEAAELLFRSAGQTDKTLRALAERKEQIQEEMRKYPADQIVDEKGSVVKKEWLERRKQLDQEAKDVQHRLAAHEGVLKAVGETLGRYRSEGAVKRILDEFRKVTLDRMQPVLARALGGIPSDEVPGALIGKIASSKDLSTVLACVDSLAALGGQAALECLSVELGNKLWSVQIAVAAGLARIDAPDAIEPLIAALGKVDGRVREEFNLALVLLTGENRHGDPAAWMDWWGRNRIDFASKRPPREEREEKRRRAALGTVEGGTTFYGIPVRSKRAMFVLDRSGSMALPALWKPRPETPSGEGAKPEVIGDRKIDVCRYELKRAIRMLPEDARFNVLFYNRDARFLNPDGLLEATKSNRERAQRFIDGVEPTGRTNIFDTLERALAAGDVDTVFLLSDGMPNCGQYESSEEIRDQIRGLNPGPRLVIHTIYTGEEKGGEELMRRLAEENGGTFVDRSKAEK